MLIDLDQYNRLKDSVRFGHGDEVVVPEKEQYRTDVLVRTLLHARANGCPTPIEVIKAQTLTRMAKRYAVLNDALRGLVDIASVHHPSLYEELTRDRFPRRVSPQKYDLRFVPDPHIHLLLQTPFERVHAHGAARLLESLGNDTKAVNLALKAMEQSPGSYVDFVPSFAELALKEGGLEIDEVLKDSYPLGLLAEQGDAWSFISHAGRIRQRAPSVWALYERLTPEERRAKGIAEVPLRAIII